MSRGVTELLIWELEVTTLTNKPISEKNNWRLWIAGLPVIVVDEAPPDFISLANLGRVE